MKRRSKQPAGLEPRPTCFTCFRPHTHCLCGLIPPFEAHCNLLILQHPHERKKYYSTAKLVIGAVKNASLLRGLYFEAATIEQALKGRRGYLLYPSKDARDCVDVPLDQSATVIVVDGTWSEAGKIMFRNPFLRDFPALTFKAPLRSNYQIRKQPRENYLSTLESIGHLLTLNARSTGRETYARSYRGLFDGFSKMVDQQLEYFPRRR